jgi:POT family proton-dependent oligopeptide transporter
MNLFADQHTDMAGLPSTLFQSLNPLMILVLAPVFAGLWVALGKRGKEPSTPLKMALGLFLLGIVIFSAVVFFQIVTLPVEFNASSRAKEIVVQ